MQRIQRLWKWISQVTLHLLPLRLFQRKPPLFPLEPLKVLTPNDPSKVFAQEEEVVEEEEEVEVEKQTLM